MRSQAEDQTRRVEELERKLAECTPVSVAHFDQAMAALIRDPKPADNRDEINVLHHRITDLKKDLVDAEAEVVALHHHVVESDKERADAQASAAELENFMEITIQKKIDEMKEALSKEEANATLRLAAEKKKIHRLTEDRDRWSKRADNLLNKLAQVESNYDALQQRDENLKESLIAEVNALKKKVRTQEDTIREREAPLPPIVRTSTRLVDLARDEDRKNKRKIDQLTQERDEALAKVSSLSRQKDGSRKRPRAKE